MLDFPFVRPQQPFLRPKQFILPSLVTAAPVPKSATLPNLNDPKIEEEIGKKYEHLGRIFPIIETAWNTWVVVNGVMTSQDFLDTGATFPAVANYNDAFNKLAEFGKPQYYFRQIGDKVQVKLNAPPISVQIGYGERKVYFARRSDREVARANCEKLIQEFIPSFKLPVRWERQGKIVPVLEGLEPGSSQPIEVWSQKEIDWTPNERYKPASGNEDEFPAWTKITLGHQYAAGYTGMLRARFAIEADSLEFTADRDNRIPYGVANGALEGISGLLTFDLQPVFFLTFPLEYALWATSATNQNEFLPKQFVTQINRLTAFAARGSKRNLPEPRLGSFTRLRKLVTEKAQKLDLVAKPRTNEDDFTILATGHIAWVPRGMDTIDEYHDLLRSAYDPETHQILPNSKIQGLPNKIIYTDWLNNKLTYTVEDGNLHVMDLNGSIPLDDVSISRLLNTSVNQQAVSEFMTKTVSGIVQQLGIEYEIVMPGNLTRRTDLSGRHISFAQAHTFLANSLPTISTETSAGAMQRMFDMSLYELFGENNLQEFHDDASSIDKPQWQAAIIITSEFKRVLTEIMQRWNDIDVPVSSKITSLRLWLMLATKYAPKHADYSKARQEAEKTNTAVTINRYDYTYDVPNLPKLESLMPHQAEATASFTNDPINSILQVSAGGGKTILQIIRAMMALEKGVARRICISMPKRLVPEFVTEINRRSDGKINPFVLTREVLERLIEVMHFDTLGLVKFLRNMPLNTIFLTYFGFLGQRRDIEGNWTQIMPYGDTTITQWPIAELIRAIGCDLVSLDEAHNLRNQTTQQARATLQIISGANRKMLSTGTFVSNSPTDMVGQMAMINPRVYGRVEDFANAYGNGDNKNVQLTDAGRRAALRAMLPYALRLIKQRKSWAYLLPDIHENRITVTLTPKQAEFYEQILAKTMVEITKSMKKAKIDPEVGETTEEEDAKIEIILQQHLARVEQFIGAPDRDEDYVNLADRPTGDDLVSPLVTMVDRIIAAQFGSGDTELQVVPDHNNKILIFSHHISVAEHCYRRMQYREMAIRYTGDDQQLVDFRSKPNIRILVGASGRIKEGFNLQVASRMINLELPWTPGRYEQEVSRFMRPDFDDKRVRSQLNRDILLARLPNGKPALSVLKFGRLISKIIETAKINNADEPSWKRVENKFATTSLVRLSIPNLQSYSFADLDEHFDTLTDYRKWENDEFTNERESLRRTVEGHIGRPITNRQDLVQQAMMPFTGTRILPGSKTVYVPFVTGAEIADRYKLGALTPLANIAETEADSENASDDEEELEESEEDAVEIREGMPVITEFGPGVIAVILKRGGRTGSIRVDVTGLGRVTLKRSVVYVPTTPEGLNKLIAIMRQAGRAGLPTLRPGGSLVDITAPEITGPIPKQRPVLPPVVPGGPTPEIPVRPPGLIGVTPKVPPKIPPRPTPSPRIILPGITPPAPPSLRPGRPPISTPITVKPTQPATPTITMKPGAITPTGIPTIKLKPGTPITQQLETPISQKPSAVNMQVATINGMIGLVLDAGSVNPGPLVAASTGWHIVPPFLSIHVTRAQTLRNLLNWLLVRYTIPDQLVNSIMSQAQRFTTVRGHLIHATPANFNDIRNFFLMEHRRVPQAEGKTKQMLIPWLTVMDEQVYINFDIRTHPAAVIANLRRLRTLFHDPGIGEIAIHPAMLIALYPNKNLAINELARVSRQIDIENLPDVRNELSSIVLNVRAKGKQQ